MPQGLLPFQYKPQKSSQGRTSLAGLGLYLDLWMALKMDEAIAQELPEKDKQQGWPASHIIRALVLLNLAGGDSVSDLRVLREDAGLCRLLRHIDRSTKSKRAHREFEARFRKERCGGLPSDSAVHRFLGDSHNAEEESKRQVATAFIPEANDILTGLVRLNKHLVDAAQRCNRRSVATLDEDATLAQTNKQEALFSYKGFKAYQPLNVYWAEQDLVLQSEFRDGNVPAGFKKLDLLKKGLSELPQGVKTVRYRADNAAYQVELLRYLAEGRDARFGVIEFAVSCDVTEAFKKAVAQLDEAEWKPLIRHCDGDKQETNQQWAEVVFVPNWAGYSKNAPLYRFIAIREPLKQLHLPQVDQQLPFPTQDFNDQTYKLHGIVTNRSLPGDEIIWWHRQRCGYSEHVHSEMKRGLAGGRLPSGRFGANAAWWSIMVLALNLNAIFRRLVLKGAWATKRIKALRFSIIRVPGAVITHARRLLVNITEGPTAQLFIAARNTIAALVSTTTDPPLPV